MIALKARWILAGLLSLSFWSAFAWAGAEEWQSHMDAGVEAYVDGDHAEAGKQYGAAVNEAEAFGADDPRLSAQANHGHHTRMSGFTATSGSTTKVAKLAPTIWV